MTMMGKAREGASLKTPALGISPLLHHGGRDVALRDAVRLWHLPPHALLDFLKILDLAPTMSGTGVWSLRSHSCLVLGRNRSDTLNQAGQ